MLTPRPFDVNILKWSTINQKGQITMFFPPFTPIQQIGLAGMIYHRNKLAIENNYTLAEIEKTNKEILALKKKELAALQNRNCRNFLDK